MTSNKGSIWRKWDLHIHTPSSYDWKGKRFSEMEDEEKHQVLLNIINKMKVANTAEAVKTAMFMGIISL